MVLPYLLDSFSGCATESPALWTVHSFIFLKGVKSVHCSFQVFPSHQLFGVCVAYSQLLFVLVHSSWWDFSLDFNPAVAGLFWNGGARCVIISLRLRQQRRQQQLQRLACSKLEITAVANGRCVFFLFHSLFFSLCFSRSVFLSFICLCSAATNCNVYSLIGNRVSCAFAMLR